MFSCICHIKGSSWLLQELDVLLQSHTNLLFKMFRLWEARTPVNIQITSLLALILFFFSSSPFLPFDFMHNIHAPMLGENGRLRCQLQ
jgi:hypothetical protein